MSRFKCPVCTSTSLKQVHVMTGRGLDVAGRPCCYDTSFFQCEGCGSALVRLDDGTLVTKEVWDARAAIPAARARKIE